MKQNRIIVADNKIPFLKGALEPYATVQYLSAEEITNERVKNADALIIRTRTLCNEELLNGTTVKLIATATIGYDHIDNSYCKKNNIRWVSAPGCNSSSVMQYIGSALLTLARSHSFDLAKRTIGIVGVGNVGRKVARLSKLLGMNVLCNDPPRMRKEHNLDFISLNEIISKSDIITFHVPLIKEGIDKTLYLAGEKFFSSLKKNTIIFNTSRGSVVNTQALKKTIQKGVVSAAVLDVWENEPKIDRELLELVEIGTPHVAGYSADGKANGAAVCVHAVSDYFQLGVPAQWYPDIPNPEHPLKLSIECAGKSFPEIMHEALTLSYDIRRDDEQLRRSSETFETQRNEYYVRREYPQYEIELNDPGSGAVFALRNLGFQVKTNYIYNKTMTMEMC